MKNKNLFQEAIADAKAIRETALANAKAALEETLTPKLQSMLAAKLNEMEDEESHFEEQEELEEIGISSVLAELEQEETLEEKKDESEENESEENESEEDESEEDESEEIKDMTVEELRELIKGIVSDELGNEEETPLDIDDEEETEMEDDTSSEEEINLDELLAELDDLEQEEIDEVKDKEEMEEALKTIKFLRKELNEVNLLNAKLLYVNKIFKSKNLTESQKIQVITSFDKATNVKEAKIVYESLTNALSSNVKKTIVKESLGFASKAAGTAFKNQIVESNEVVNRMQKLANIIK